jgi:hypothetical protein
VLCFGVKLSSIIPMPRQSVSMVQVGSARAWSAALSFEKGRAARLIIWRIWQQVQWLRLFLGNNFDDAGDLPGSSTRQIVNNYDVTGSKRRHKHLGSICLERVAIHRPLQNPEGGSEGAMAPGL